MVASGRMRADQCTARNRHTGMQCKRWATMGAKVCVVHGAQFPIVKNAAARERTMWEVGQRAEREGRHPMEVLRTVLHVRDHVLGVMLARVRDRDDVTTAEIRELDEHLDKAQRAAEVAIRSGVELWHAQRTELDAEEMTGIFLRALERVDLNDFQRWELRAAIADELVKADQREGVQVTGLPALPSGFPMDGTVFDGDVLDG